MPDTPRAASVRESYFNERGFSALEALDEVADAHGSTPAAVALAWLAAQPTVLAPIASATSPAQVRQLVDSARLELSEQELLRLSAAAG
jgi:aryl-alcohol dehydrogenase-like predicted oxidoreductase